MSGTDEEMRKRFGLGLSGVKADVLGAIEQAAPSGGRGSDHIGPVAQDKSVFGNLLPGTAAAGLMPDKVKEEGMQDEEEL